MIPVIICELFGWDLETYMNQPTWFIDLIKFKLKVDADKQKQLEIQNKHGIRK
jgi:hypothetical protein